MNTNESMFLGCGDNQRDNLFQGLVEGNMVTLWEYKCKVYQTYQKILVNLPWMQLKYARSPVRHMQENQFSQNIGPYLPPILAGDLFTGSIPSVVGKIPMCFN